MTETVKKPVCIRLAAWLLILPPAPYICGQASAPMAPAQKVLSQRASSSKPATASAGSVYANSVAESVQIGPGDLIDVAVFDTAELSQRSRVDASGALELVLGGKVELSGLNTTAAKLAIEKRLRDAQILLDPHVNVEIIESASQGVTVLGEVKNPGTYPFLGRPNVLDLISAAGGLTQYASHTVTLTHNGSSSTLTLSLGAASSAEPEPSLHPGDRIVVGRAGTVYVLGDVGRPGGYMLDDKDSMTVLQGVALAQGFNRTAKLNGTLIRSTPRGPQPQELDLKKILQNQSPDPTLHDGDIVYVPVNGAKDWASKGINSILQMAVGVVIYGRY